MPIDDFKKIVSPQDIMAMEREMREKDASLEREKISDFNEEQRTLEDDPDATMTGSGKVIKRRSRSSKTKNSLEEIKEIARMFGGEGLFDIGGTKGLLHSMIEVTSKLGNDFSTQAASPLNKHKYKDKDYTYDTERVSEGTFNRLEQENAIVTAALEKIAGTADEKQKKVLLSKLQILVEEFQMIPHPVTGRYIHCIDHVHDMEKKFNPQMKQDLQIGLALVYRVNEVTADVRGVKSRVGDVYDQNPQEAIASGGHLNAGSKGPNPSGP